MAREKSPSWGVKLLMLVASIVVGYFVSRVLEDRPSTPEADPHPVEEPQAHEPAPAEKHEHEAPPPPVEELPESGLKEVDYALLSEDYEAGLKLAREKKSAAPKKLIPGFRYREALALEASGDYAAAAPIYHEVADQLQHPVSWLRVRLREASCLARSDKKPDARKIFAELHAFAGEDEYPDVTFFGELYVAVAMCEVPSLVPLSTPTCDNVKVLSVPAPPFPVKRWIGWADEPEEAWDYDFTEFVLPKFPARDSVQAIRDALEIAPSHPQAPYIRLALACLQAQRGQRLSAVAELSRLLVGHPYDKMAIHAAYNRGLLELQDSEFKSAGESFLEVVDRATTPNWKALGWWWVGRSRMDSGQANKAISPLIEAAFYGKGTPIECFSVLALATAQLASDEPWRTHQRLDTMRLALRKQPYRPYAAFLDARSRLNIALGQGRRSVGAERDDLLEAILQFPSETPLGPLMDWLVGEAASEIGLSAIARPRFEAALKNLRGSLAVRMIYRVAEEEARAGRMREAKNSFAAAAVDPGEWGIRARIQLGEFALREEKPVEALQRAFEIYQQSPESKEQALLLMGKAYLLLGDTNRAATCFGGNLPTEE